MLSVNKDGETTTTTVLDDVDYSQGEDGGKMVVCLVRREGPGKTRKMRGRQQEYNTTEQLTDFLPSTE